MVDKTNIKIDNEGKLTVETKKDSFLGALLANKKSVKIKLGGAEEKTAEVKLT